MLGAAAVLGRAGPRAPGRSVDVAPHRACDRRAVAPAGACARGGAGRLAAHRVPAQRARGDADGVGHPAPRRPDARRRGHLAVRTPAHRPAPRAGAREAPRLPHAHAGADFVRAVLVQPAGVDRRAPRAHRARAGLRRSGAGGRHLRHRVRGSADPGRARDAIGTLPVDAGGRDPRDGAPIAARRAADGDSGPDRSALGCVPAAHRRGHGALRVRGDAARLAPAMDDRGHRGGAGIRSTKRRQTRSPRARNRRRRRHQHRRRGQSDRETAAEIAGAVESAIQSSVPSGVRADPGRSAGQSRVRSRVHCRAAFRARCKAWLPAWMRR